MIRINLLPVKAAQKKEKLKGQLLVAALVLIVSCALCGLAYIHVLGKVQEKRQQIEAKRFEISKLMKTIGEVNQYKKRQQELQAKLDVLAQLQEARTGPVFLLDELEKALPEKVWLTDFKESKGSISIKGISINEEAVALFMRNLEASDYYANVELKVTQQKIQSGMKLQSFDLQSKAEKQKPEIKAVQAEKTNKVRRGT